VERVLSSPKEVPIATTAAKKKPLIKPAPVVPDVKGKEPSKGTIKSATKQTKQKPNTAEPQRAVEYGVLQSLQSILVPYLLLLLLCFEALC
jgi:hypothetical protein